MRTIPGKGNSTPKQLVDRALAAQQITRQDYLLLTSALLSASDLTEAERRDINRLFDTVQTGRLKLID